MENRIVSEDLSHMTEDDHLMSGQVRSPASPDLSDPIVSDMTAAYIELERAHSGEEMEMASPYSSTAVTANTAAQFPEQTIRFVHDEEAQLESQGEHLMSGGQEQISPYAEDGHEYRHEHFTSNYIEPVSPAYSKTTFADNAHSDIGSGSEPTSPTPWTMPGARAAGSISSAWAPGHSATNSMHSAWMPNGRSGTRYNGSISSAWTNDRHTDSMYSGFGPGRVTDSMYSGFASNNSRAHMLSSAWVPNSRATDSMSSVGMPNFRMDDTMSSAWMSRLTVADSMISGADTEYKPTHPEVTSQLDLSPEAAPAKKPNPPNFTAFSRPKKLFIIFMSAWGGFISPLSGSIYLPALTTLSKYYDVTPNKINLTVSTYMIFQGLTPMFIGNFGDNAGFRPAFVLCFLVYAVANIGLATQSSFAALMVLRCLQSMGSGGTVALRNGQLASILTPAERGGVMGVIQVFMLLAPAFAPLIGGLLSQHLGWRAIFWFLVILSTTCLAAYALFMPETNRKIVGNGSIPPTDWWNKSLLDMKVKADDDVENRRIAAARAKLPKRKLRWPNPWRSIEMIGEKDVAIVLFYNSIMFSVLYTVMTAVPVLYERIYGLDVIKVALCYIPIGAGAGVAALVNGKYLNWNFRRVARANNLPVEKKKGQDLRHFPIEQARMGAVFPLLALSSLCLVGYGWALEKHAPLAVPLVLVFFAGMGSVASFSCCATLLIDMYPATASTVTGGNNLVRCLMGAVATAVINPLLEALGAGWTYTLIAGLCVVYAPLLVLELRHGPRWREERRVRIERKAAVKEERKKVAVGGVVGGRAGEK